MINTTTVTEISKKNDTEVNSRSSLKVILRQCCWYTRCVAKTNNGQDGQVKSVNGVYLLVHSSFYVVKYTLGCKTYTNSD